MALEMMDCRSQHGRKVTKSGLSSVAYAGRILASCMGTRPALLLGREPCGIFNPASCLERCEPWNQGSKG